MKCIVVFSRVVPVILKDRSENLSALDMAFANKVAMDLVRKFIGEASCTSLLVVREGHQEEEEHGEEKDHVTYSITNNIHYNQEKMTSVVCLKRGQVIEKDKSISSQLRVISLSDGSAYKTLVCNVSDFKSCVSEAGKVDTDRRGGKIASSLEKMITELEVGLFHLKQNIDIPDISLVVHPTVSQVIKQCFDNGVKATVEDFGVLDSTFLNDLQNQVILILVIIFFKTCVPGEQVGQGGPGGDQAGQRPQL